MTSPVPAIGSPLEIMPSALAGGPASTSKPAGTSFDQMLIQGIENVNQNVVEADLLVQNFALNGDVAPHQVTFALEQSRLSLELMMQVRSRLVEGYQELMRMQL